MRFKALEAPSIMAFAPSRIGSARLPSASVVAHTLQYDGEALNESNPSRSFMIRYGDTGVGQCALRMTHDIEIESDEITADDRWPFKLPGSDLTTAASGFAEETMNEQRHDQPS